MPVLPSLQLKSKISQFDDYAYWNEDDNTGDPYIGYSYQWKVTIDCDLQPHGNHTTQTPNYYTGRDVQVGDWFASGVQGRANIVKEIISADDYKIVCVIEDFERYNIFTDPNQSGTGMCAPFDPGIFFRIGQDGLPILGPIDSGYFGDKTVEDLIARFMARNGSDEFVLVRQEFHGFFPGDVIYADFETDIGYKKADRANLQKAIGIVTEINVPGLNYFSYRPMGRLINNVNPPLWGSHGDVFYMNPDEPGTLTNERPTGIAIPVYLQLDLPNRAILLERGVEVATASSETNKYDVEKVTAGQTTFTLPNDCREVLYMAINGIENENYTFNVVSKVLQFDPVETGYGVDVDDEVFFVYKS